MENEIWKPVRWYKQYYLVSDLGNILHLRNDKILIGYIDKDGYRCVNLRGKSGTKIRFIHRLVAIAFIPNPQRKPQVNHINGIKSDCRKSNLEWATASENEKHAWRIGLKHKSQYKKNTTLSIPIMQLNVKGEFIRYWPSLSEINRCLGYKKSRIGAAAKLGNKLCNGFLWSLAPKEIYSQGSATTLPKTVPHHP